MILPSKRVKPEDSLLALGNVILSQLETPKTVSELWDEICDFRKNKQVGNISFDWFVIALDFLYAISAIDFNGNHVARSSH